ncbi:MAG: DUF2586 family protein [Bacteroidota bacterium]
MLNDVNFNLGQGGLGRPLPGSDFISTMLFYTGTLPSGFSSTDRIKKIFSVEDAESLGILDTYADETKATAKYTVTNVGADGDTLELVIVEPSSNISLGVFLKTAAYTTVTLFADALVLFINANTLTHGYTAANTAGAVTITARPGLGLFLNSGTPVVATIVGTIAGTIVQFGASPMIAGVASLQAPWHYHISEFFRIQPKGVLYVGMYAVPSTYDFTDLTTIQNFANGEIRQAFVYADGTTYTSGKVQAAQAVCTSLFVAHKPLSSVLIAFDYASATLSTLANLSTLNSKNITLVIGQDGDNLGYALFKACGKSITNGGAVLGCEALAAVNEDIAWISKFNISNGTENNVPAFANGILFSACSTSLLTTLNSYRYVFSIKKVGYEGTFLNDSHDCIIQTSDYAYIENNRTIDKAIRLLYTNYLPDLNAPLTVNTDGTLKDTSVAYFQMSGNAALDQMVRDGELSAKSVTVNPVQNVLTSSQLVITVTLVPVGVARNIVINIGYSLSI